MHTFYIIVCHTEIKIFCFEKNMDFDLQLITLILYEYLVMNEF